MTEPSAVLLVKTGMRRVQTWAFGLAAFLFLGVGLFSAVYPFLSRTLFGEGPGSLVDWAWLWLVVAVPAWFCDHGLPMGNALVGTHYDTPYLTAFGITVVYALPGMGLFLLWLRGRARRMREEGKA